MIDVAAHEIQTDHRAGRMLAATLASTHKAAKTVLTVDLESAEGARYHQTFSIRHWTNQIGHEMLTVEVEGSGSWAEGTRRIKMLHVDTKTAQTLAARDPRNADKLLRYAAECALAYAWLGEAGLPTPANGSITVLETSHCGHCGIKLKDPVSIERGVGPTCYGKATGTKTIRSRARVA